MPSEAVGMARAAVRGAGMFLRTDFDGRIKSIPHGPSRETC